MKYYVYNFINLVNGKIYVGKTNDIRKRFRDHISISKRINHKDEQLVHKAIRKYGIINFQMNIIQQLKSSEEASQAEQYGSNIIKLI